MKARFLALMALVLGMVSCQNDFEGTKIGGDEVAVTLNVAVPDNATRAAGDDSGIGAIGNIDLVDTYDIRYVLNVYDKDGELAKGPITKYQDDALSEKFTISLVPGRYYKFVVWADFVLEGKEEALHYDVTDFAEIKTLTEQRPMDESRDAYTGFIEVAEFNGYNAIDKLELTRPFAKLRVVTTDMNELYTDLETATVVYTSKLYTTFNAIEAKATGLEGMAGITKHVDFTTDNDAYVYNETAYEAEGKKTLFADYFFGAEDNKVTFTFDVTDNTENPIPQVVFNTNIPVQRNYLTTVMGPILTDSNNITVIINDAFNKPDNVVDIWDGESATEPAVEADPVTGEPVAVIDSAADLAWFAQYVNGTIASTLSTRGNDVMNFVLTTDIDLDNHPWTPIGSADADHGFTGNFDGNNHIIKNLNIVDTNGGYVGLFGVTEGQADSNHNMISENRVANFTLENVNIVSNGDIVAAVIAYPYYTNVENITVKGNVNIKGRDYTAGVLAYTRRCVNVNNIAVEANEGSVVEGRMTVGGIISDIQTNGGLKANYSNFATSGLTVKGSKMVGGISGIICNQTLNGAAVENVTIVCDDVRKGAISGALGGASVITDAVVNNVEGAERLIGSTYNAGDECTVTINGVVYEYLANGACKVDGTVVVDNNDQFQAAIAAGETSIVLGKGTFDLPSSLTQNEGTLTIKGRGNDVTVLNGAMNTNGNHPGNYANGVALEFEGLTFKTANNGYNGGFGHAVSVTFRESKIVGLFYAHSNAPHYFYNCTIDPLTGYLYTYGSDCVFEGCTFAASEGKALQIYEDATSGENTVTITNCAFVAAKQATTWDGKPVTGIDINSNGAKFEVYINNCTTTGFPTGLNSNSNLWNVKDAGKAHANVYVDGVQVWFAGGIAPGVMLNEAGEYLIMNATGMFWFANEVNVNKNTFSGKVVKLAENINLNNVAWTPVGQTGATQFKGTFDGNNKTISNLKIDTTAENGEYYSTGIFGWLLAAKVKNVTVDGASIKGNHNVAAIAGYLEWDGCTVENCHVKNATIIGNYKNDNLDGDKCGAIVAYAGNANTYVKDCTATDCTVTASRDAGQIVGAGKEVNVTNCVATNVTVAHNGQGTGKNIRNEVIGRLL